MKRKENFKSQTIFHVFNKSISNFDIFTEENNSLRFIECLDYYNNLYPKEKYSIVKEKNIYKYQNILLRNKNSLVNFISFCIMPDHYHLLIKILDGSMFSKYLGDIENSYCRYFNLKHNRKGPLWQSRFKAVKIKNEEQLLHISRYIHLNPVTAGLVGRPEEWLTSSYRDIITNKFFLNKIIGEISIRNSSVYKKFVENNINYQKKLKKIKKLILE